MTELPSGLDLEPFRDQRHPNVFWVEDEHLCAAITKSYLQRGDYGIEVGFGGEPTSVCLLDNSVDWLLTERDPYMFGGARSDATRLDFFPGLAKKGRVFLLGTTATEEMVRKAKIILMRNLDYQGNLFMDYLFPHRAYLKPGQRIILVVNQACAEEIGGYRRLLIKRGYDHKLLTERSEDLPSLARKLLGWEAEYVFDFTG